MTEATPLAKKRILSGMRPTGQLHLGHWLGVLTNWERLQSEYECYFFAADWHALTTKFNDTANIRQDTRLMFLDWLAAGVDPEQATIFIQSAVQEVAELNLLFSMITPVNWLQRNPTVKEQAEELHLAEDSMTAGLLGYPVLMGSDILAFKGDRVPVGKDQLPHLEFSRDMARRFNHLYGETFPEPQAVLTEAPSLVGTDGRKMSKSYGNDIKLADTSDVVTQKVMTMVTDPQRQRKSDPGNPDVCTVFSYYKVLAPQMVEQVDSECRSAGIGCVQCKRRMAETLNGVLDPLRERREHFAQQPELLDEVLEEGNRKARETAQETLAEVREVMKLNVHTPAAAKSPC
ncbi:Tryptophan--tRNA ligase [compost metagenome]